VASQQFIEQALSRGKTIMSPRNLCGLLIVCLVFAPGCTWLVPERYEPALNKGDVDKSTDYREEGGVI